MVLGDRPQMNGKKKRVYRFDEGDATMRNLLGGKGANLSEMVKMGLPVPPGFVITTEVSLEYYDLGKKMPEGLWEDITANMRVLEASVGRKFGDAKQPLLVSVRSGARFSMPGMMDTILNLGINDDIVEGLVELMGEKRSAMDAYRRFLQIFGNVAMGMESSEFEEILDEQKIKAGVLLDHELGSEDLVELVKKYKELIIEATGRPFPSDPWDQLREAVISVFESWNNQRAMDYRNYRGIPHDLGTGVNIQAMVYGNTGENSGTGVLFTRNPATGENYIYGEYLPNAQGEDVVAGVRTPYPVTQLGESHPVIYEKLMGLAKQLETHYRDVQDVEFTVEQERLYLLQTRNAQRTAAAAVKTAVDMVVEGLITKKESIQRVESDQLSMLFVPRFDEDDRKRAVSQGELIAVGTPASPGAATGLAVFDPNRAAEAGMRGESVILVRAETTPDDINGILQSVGILTSRGGTTSHAAVVTRGLGKPCIVGTEEIKFARDGSFFESRGQVIKEGDEISIDGATGEVFQKHITTVAPNLDELNEARQLLSWADEFRTLGVWANADTESDAKRALSMGAEGIGLCRTEHMFLGPERVAVVQRMLLNAAEAENWQSSHGEVDLLSISDSLPEDLPLGVSTFYEALGELEKLQVKDFTDILNIMGDRPVIIRLLDAPLHEFLPRYEELVRKSTEFKMSNSNDEDLQETERLLELLEQSREANPMLGHRGCRLGISFPSVYRMQVKAIITACCELQLKGQSVQPEIMIPLTSHVNEMRILRERLTKVAKTIQDERGVEVRYKFGTMIEVPRAALTADKMASESDFFSFGTNDLTQTTFGYSRDDAEGKFLRAYIEDGVLPEDPFLTLDAEGVGSLIQIAVEKGRKVKPDLEVGICGEHGGDPASIDFCHRTGLNYVSSSPFRVPVARLAAAQAALRDEK